MEKENNITMSHNYISFFERAKYYIIIYIIIILVILFSLLLGKEFSNINNNLFIICLFFGFPISFKIYKSRIYLKDFFSDSQTVKIIFLNFSEQQIVISTMAETKVVLNNISSRTGFDCELELSIADKQFIINTDFGWNLTEIKEIFEYIKYQKFEKLTEKEKFTLFRISEAIKKN